MKRILPLEAARDTLGLSAASTASELRAAYRAMVRAHPPDHDPEAFRAIRSAYELLSRPLRIAEDWLVHRAPHNGATNSPPLVPFGLPQLGDGCDLARAGLVALLMSQPLAEFFPGLDLDQVDQPESP